MRRPGVVWPVLLLLAAATALFNCGGGRRLPPPSRRVAPQLAPIGYSVQVGAFANLENAVSLEKRLQARGIDAFYFRHFSGLYKVRFGDFPSAAAARAQAEKLRRAGIITAYFVVSPQRYEPALDRGREQALRRRLVATAKRFLGTPYRWAGDSAATGFDCSGLTVAVYRLCGLKLPRSSRQQFRYGLEVDRRRLAPGDLVFFATRGGREVSHVGIYIGRDKFIHAPAPGRTVAIETLNNRYFARRFVGARTYLR